MKLEVISEITSFKIPLDSKEFQFDPFSKTLLITSPLLDHPEEFLAVQLESLTEKGDGIKMKALKRTSSGLSFGPATCEIRITF